MWICFVKSVSLLFIVTSTTQFLFGALQIQTLTDCIVKLNKRAARNVCKIRINEQIPLKDMHLSTHILEITNIHKYELAKYMNNICYQMLSKEMTEEHE